MSELLSLSLLFFRSPVIDGKSYSFLRCHEFIKPCFSLSLLDRRRGEVRERDFALSKLTALSLPFDLVSSIFVSPGLKEAVTETAVTKKRVSEGSRLFVLCLFRLEREQW